MKRLIRLAIAMLFAVFATFTGAVNPQTIELKLSHWLPPSHPLMPATQAWADAVGKSSGGALKITVYPSEQLGKTFDHYDMARDGLAEITVISPGFTPGRFPIANATALPFLIANGTDGSRAVDDWYRRYAASEMKDTRYCLGYVHDPGALHLTKKKVLVPDDMKGLKIRPGGGTVGAFITLLGGSTVQASPAEARQVMERGLADGITFPWGSTVLFKIDQAAKFHMNVPLYTTHQMFMINPAAYGRLNATQKKALDDNCTIEQAYNVAKPWDDFEKGGLARIRAQSGHEVYDLTADQLALWRKAAVRMQEQWGETVKKVGGDPKAVMDDLTATLKKYNAGY